jgi:hypothetical protein
MYCGVMSSAKNEKIKQVMGEYASEKLRSGNAKEGPIVKKKAQAVAIALSETGKTEAKGKKK